MGEVTLLNAVKVDLPWAIMGADQYSKSIGINAIREPLFIASRKYLAALLSKITF